jgi:hypothetical protein
MHGVSMHQFKPEKSYEASQVAEPDSAAHCSSIKPAVYTTFDVPSGAVGACSLGACEPSNITRQALTRLNITALTGPTGEHCPGEWLLLTSVTYLQYLVGSYRRLQLHAAVAAASAGAHCFMCR